jgi:hypothetical protein
MAGWAWARTEGMVVMEELGRVVRMAVHHRLIASGVLSGYTR